MLPNSRRSWMSSAESRGGDVERQKRRLSGPRRVFIILPSRTAAAPRQTRSVRVIPKYPGQQLTSGQGRPS